MKPKIYEEDNEFQSKKPLRAKVKVIDDIWCSDDYVVDMTFYPDTKDITIWGDDDFGMEKTNCLRVDFEQISKMTINQQMLKKLGFKNIQ